MKIYVKLLSFSGSRLSKRRKFDIVRGYHKVKCAIDSIIFVLQDHIGSIVS